MVNLSRNGKGKMVKYSNSVLRAQTKNKAQGVPLIITYHPSFKEFNKLSLNIYICCA